MDLLNLCLTSTYFQYNGKHYKQLHGTATGSPVSVVVAEIVMQHVEERALATCRQAIPLWLRYVGICTVLIASIKFSVNDKQTYEELKRDPTPALQRKLNSKILTLKKTDAIDTQRYYRLLCSVPQPPKLCGLPKLHKPGVPMRPIVSFCGFPTYQLSRYLTTILQPLTDKSRRKLQSTENFIDAIKTVQIPDDYKLVSFDVKSLFTSFPLQLVLQCTETAIQQSTVKLPLPTEDIMDLLNLCLTSTYFQYNGKHYKQLHGTAMGSPVSVVVAEVVMQHVEERALATCRQTIPLWLRYVDDTFTAVHNDEIDDFHDHLNEQNADIQFTKVIEENGKLAFLDCLVSRDNNELHTTVYRKPTHTDKHRGNTFFDVTVTGQWSLPSACLPSILPSIDRRK